MLAVRYFFWFVLLAFGTMVVLLFAAPALPVHPLREVAEGQRTTIAGAAAATLVVAFVALFLIKGLWTNELKALAPSRFGLLTLLISSFVAVSGWTVVVMLQWNALDILPRPQDQSVAVAVLSVWLGLVGAATTWVCWITFRERALRPVFSAALESGKLGAVLGAVETAPGAQRLVDPVTFHPSVAWVLDVETTDYWTTTTPLSKGEQTAGQGPVKRESLPRHKRHPSVVSMGTTFYVQSPTVRVRIPEARVRVIPNKRVTWEEGQPPLPPLPSPVIEELRRRGFVNSTLGVRLERYGSRSIAPGDIVSAVGLIVVDADGTLYLEATRSIVPKFWNSPLHGVKARVDAVSRREKKMFMKSWLGA